MFKLLALRVLDGCADYMKKCLHEDVYYYFCADYRLDDSTYIYKGSPYSDPLQGIFFSPNQKLPFETSKLTTPKPIISLNAIVGKMVMERVRLLS